MKEGQTHWQQQQQQLRLRHEKRARVEDEEQGRGQRHQGCCSTTQLQGRRQQK
jgi:hypothetical protein